MKKLVIDQKTLKENIEKIKNYAPKLDNNEEYTIIGIVKGNGYGLDLIKYSKFLINNGIKMLAVATVEEALELRRNDIKVDILMLSTINSKKELQELVENDILITIGSTKSAQLANEIAEEGYNIRAHIKIDTGFGRYGFIYDDYRTIVETIEHLNKNIQIEGIYSHFSMSYYKNNKWTKEQFSRFINLIEVLETNNIKIKMKHICNSPAFLNYPNMHLNAARIGSAFLGRVNAEVDIGLKRIGEFMAVTKFLSRKTRLDTIVKYIMNGEKTEKMMYVSGVNCRPDTAIYEIQDTTRRFDKDGGLISYHLIQSFDGKEVSPKKCHELGLQYAKELFGDDFQFVVATHLNTDNVHNHIVINSVSFSPLRFTKSELHAKENLAISILL